MKKRFIGFGFAPEESTHHFYVLIQPKRNGNDRVSIYERFLWDSGRGQKIRREDILKLEIPRENWSRIAETVTNEFNRTLHLDGLPAGRFRSGGTPMGRLIGKELMVLLWGIEDCDPSCIPAALRNWLGLQPEERWWLYTITNASTGAIGDGGRGWRAALRYALCGNPVDDVP